MIQISHVSYKLSTVPNSDPIPHVRLKMSNGSAILSEIMPLANLLMELKKHGIWDKLKELENDQ
jgi:hypothetical protein